MENYLSECACIYSLFFIHPHTQILVKAVFSSQGEVDAQTIEEYLELEKKIASAETFRCEVD